MNAEELQEWAKKVLDRCSKSTEEECELEEREYTMKVRCPKWVWALFEEQLAKHGQGKEMAVQLGYSLEIALRNSIKSAIAAALAADMMESVTIEEAGEIGVSEFMQMEVDKRWKN